MGSFEVKVEVGYYFISTLLQFTLNRVKTQTDDQVPSIIVYYSYVVRHFSRWSRR